MMDRAEFVRRGMIELQHYRGRLAKVTTADVAMLLDAADRMTEMDHAALRISAIFNDPTGASVSEAIRRLDEAVKG